MDNSYRCHVISLAREPQKRAEFLERNRETGLNFEVFDAIDGHAMTFEDCARNGVVRADAVSYKQGSLGCASSHRALWTEADRTQRNLLVFEDDAYCRRDIAHQIEQILSGLREWDTILLGYNTDAVLDFRISEHCNFSGFFSNKYPSRQQLEAFTRENTSPVPVRLNNAFGQCSYLVSPQGARKLLALFPLDNRPVRIPGNKIKFGKEDFPCTTLDMTINTLCPHMNSYVTIPPLALPPNDQATSSTRIGASLRERTARNPVPPPQNFMKRLKKLGARKLRALFPRR